ncbi:ComEC/Rec2 family competence protein [Arcicella sp. LKC2W]|uniref:ComEC/Rec2 family competence protein n=1 Tax=Arcicella sp. LKC2W TaxID=2984198 RepID=UPI002B1F5B0D|nr:ComEC/Rec2 family competence protein [Arcicella sp. LKC2W]MEA5461181.1 ComEC/Rec2 family competence protein [Arcicella sp. LKC2W]
MNHFSTFPFVRYVILLIGGILFYHFFPSLPIYFVFGCWIFSAFLYAILFNFRRKITNHFFAGFAGSLFLILTAYEISFLKHESNYPQHYTHWVENVQYYEVIVDNLVEEKENSWKSVGEVHSVITNNEILPTSGKILLYFDNQTVEKPCYGDIFFVKGIPQEIASPKNPKEFDYQQYMRNQNISYQQYLRSENIEKVGNKPPEILINFALRINAHVDSILTTFVEGKNQYGVAIAMILGQRDDLSNDLMQAYSAAGAIHVLSVSGLHVGVIYGVLLWIFGFMRKKGKTGKFILFWLIFLILWSYAFITGLSSPVLRSTIMFSIFLFAKIFQKNKDGYNTTAFSAFCILLYNPNFLFNVGFQLSYLAVFGMIFFQPLLNPLFVIDKKKNWIYWLGDRIWKITTVAVAAQIATLPVTIYYFHQFPNYFLFANPAVIVLSSIVLICGLAFVILAKLLLLFDLTTITNILGQCLKYTILSLNKTVLWFENLPFSITKFLWISTYEMWLMYGLIFSLIALWKTRKYVWVWISCGFVGNLFFLNFHEKLQRNQQDLCTILSTPKHSAITFVNGKNAIILANKSFLDSRKDVGFRVNNYWSSLGVRDTLKLNLLENYYSKNDVVNVQSQDSIAVISWKDKTFLWIGKNLKHKDFEAKNVSVDYLILANKSVKDLNQIIGKVQFNNLIIDASYTRWYADKLSTQAEEMGLKYFDLSRSGALKIENNE